MLPHTPQSNECYPTVSQPKPSNSSRPTVLAVEGAIATAGVKCQAHWPVHHTLKPYKQNPVLFEPRYLLRSFNGHYNYCSSQMQQQLVLSAGLGSSPQEPCAGVLTAPLLDPRPPRTHTPSHCELPQLQHQEAAHSLPQANKPHAFCYGCCTCCCSCSSSGSYCSSLHSAETAPPNKLVPTTSFGCCCCRNVSHSKGSGRQRSGPELDCCRTPAAAAAATANEPACTCCCRCRCCCKSRFRL